MTTTMRAPQATGPAFRWSRFAALVRVDLAERWRSYGSVLLVALVVQVLVLGWMLFMMRAPNPMDIGAQRGWFNSFLFIFGVAFCFVFFAPMQRQGSSLLILMRPASIFEKWLHAALVLLVLFPLAYTLVYLLATVPLNGIAALIESARYEQAAATLSPLPEKLRVGLQVFIPFLSIGDRHSSERWEQLLLHWWYTVICGFAAFALVRFHRAAVFKSLALAFFVLLFSVMVLSSGSRMGGDPRVLTSWLDGDGTFPFSVSAVLANLLLWLCTPLLVWGSAYLALRERDLT
ncbi:hypothetical protein G7047_16305 [Diaphorobacter sp. HDW4A]|uniref:hypothetical protein n=1 Tax=Diaphorobacter sp. HDW4A TaxID=2714924 RepID=UPI00140CB221|nr:hypothetical protein [Diaphorobacter sp. HDW4A]QIL81299.1 hypothetical protein G7047_16305 [Diaphorobacter sp. HDW4A]